jgi:DNA gyrase inhibitor GyrI
VIGFISLYKAPAQIYRAGVSVAEPPKELPEGVRYEKFKGGKYSKFVLTGPYSQLPAASGRVFELVKQRKSPCAMTPVSRTTSTTRAPHRKTS